MTLLLVMLATFPAERVANLPTGKLPETGVWQLNISHRFVPSVTAPGWRSDVVQFLNGADVRDVLDKSLGERVTVGASFTVSTRELGLHAAWAPVAWLTLYPEVTADVHEFAVDSTWANLGIAVHRTLWDRLALVGQPRLTTNSKQVFGSLGLAAKAQVLPSWSAGIEAEPVLLGRDTTTALVPWTFAVEKEYGWHNFVLTLGSSLHQTAPGWFRTNRSPYGAYDEVLDIAKGHFRIGFNVLRKI